MPISAPVLQIHNEEEVARILPIAAKHGVPVTFRAAGTSLSGQAVTDSVLLKLSHTGNNFRKFHIPVSVLADLAQPIGLLGAGGSGCGAHVYAQHSARLLSSSGAGSMLLT